MRGKLYTVRILRGLTTVEEAERLYDWQARDWIMTKAGIGAALAQAVVEDAGMLDIGGGRSILVLGSDY
jgi:hypothetical protein